MTPLSRGELVTILLVFRYGTSIQLIMKALFGLLIFFACISTMQGQAPAPRICITALCTTGKVKKSDILSYKKINVVSDTMTIESFAFSANIKGNYAEANCNGNAYCKPALDILERISTATRIFYNINFISSSVKKYKYGYFYTVFAK
jgi:hypothetical protein